MLRAIIKKYFFKIKLVRRIAIACITNNGLLPDILTSVSAVQIRRAFFLPESDYSSQNNQDIYALFFNKFQPGFFIEIGANDGFTFSNTVYLEERYSWKGILIEANPKYLESLKKRVNSLVVNKAVFDSSGTIEFIDAGLYGGVKENIDTIHSRHTRDANIVSVPCDSLEKILDSFDGQIPKVIDFISVDVEGVELLIVQQLIKLKYTIKCGVIEVNNRSKEKEEIESLLLKSGYIIDANYSKRQDLYFYDPAFLG